MVKFMKVPKTNMLSLSFSYYMARGRHNIKPITSLVTI